MSAFVPAALVWLGATGASRGARTATLAGLLKVSADCRQLGPGGRHWLSERLAGCVHGRCRPRPTHPPLARLGEGWPAARRRL